MSEQDFFNHLERSIEEAKTYGYNPISFRKMLAQAGAIGTARNLIATDQPSEGFYHLAKLGKLNLSLEYAVLKHPHLFTEEELAKAQERLEEARAWGEA